MLNINLEDMNKLNEFKNQLENKEIVIEKNINNVHSGNYNTTSTNINNINLKDIKRGDVVWVKLFGSVGSEQSSDEHGRPCVVIQNNIGNAFSPTIIVACITSQLTKAKLPIHVEISSSEKYGLTKNSVVLLEQLRTLDKRLRIVKKAGHLDDLVMKKINKALEISVLEMEEKTPLERLDKFLREVIIRKIDNIHSFEKAWINSKTNNESFKNMCLKERQLCLEDLEDFCIYNNLNYKDYYTQYSESYEEVM